MRLLVGPPSISTRARRAGSVATSVTLHLSVLAALFFSATRVRFETATGAPQIEVTSVSAESVKVPQVGDTDLPAEERLETPDPDAGAAMTPDGMSFDIPKIRAQRDSLFPFLTIGLSFLEHIDQTSVAAQGRLGNPFAGVTTTTSQPTLDLKGPALQKVIDSAFTRRHRWHAFDEIRKLIETHDANNGDLPRVMQEYLEQNLLQPFCDGKQRDPRFWAMLENASDHLAFIEFVRKYAWEHPMSKTTTELLFLLDELTQASRSTLLMLMGTDPERDLTFTADQTRDGLELAVGVQRQYADWLEAHKMWPLEVVRARFDQVRLRILMTILESTPGGYRSGDARYLAGEVFVDLGNVPDAIAQWRQIDPNPNDSYFAAYSKVRASMATAPPGILDLTRVLQREYGDWRLGAIERLSTLGMRCDRY
jgi:hypothetical protein